MPILPLIIWHPLPWFPGPLYQHTTAYGIFHMVTVVSGGFILSSNFQVEDKVKDLDISWSRAVDLVKAEKLIEQCNKPGGVDPLLVIICKWPQIPEYKANPKRIPSLEFLVRNID